MPFHWQTFKTRTLTAIIFGAVMLTGLFVNSWTFLLLFSIIHFGCWFEYQKLMMLIEKEYKSISAFHKYGVMITGFSFMLWLSNSQLQIIGIRIQEIGWWSFLIFLLILPIIETLFSDVIQIRVILISLVGLIYISLSWALMIDLSVVDNQFISQNNSSLPYWTIPILIISSIWINDTMAYVVGSFIGKTPFSKISPKKTWEGTIGGAILAIVIITLVGMNFYSLEWKPLLIISSVAAVFGTLGDLLESKIKRMANVKDSGNFMPGHGGFLDRFDSLLIAIPFTWLLLKLIFSLYLC